MFVRNHHYCNDCSKETGDLKSHSHNFLTTLRMWLTCHYYLHGKCWQGPPQWCIHVDTETEVPSLKNPKLSKAASFKPGAGQNIAIPCFTCCQGLYHTICFALISLFPPYSAYHSWWTVMLGQLEVCFSFLFPSSCSIWDCNPSGLM